MTQEEKAIAYDEAIQKANNILKGKCKNFFVYNHYNQGMIEYIFNELKESDEKIKKELIEFLKKEEAKADITSKRSKTLCKYITWLEKQSNKVDATLPEPKNSKHEEIRKNLLNLIENIDEKILNINHLYKTEVRVWLEKQSEKKSADKVKPKFKIGDKIIKKDFDECVCCTIIDIEDGKYIFDSGSFIYIKEQDLWELVEQKSTDKAPKFKIGRNYMN